MRRPQSIEPDFSYLGLRTLIGTLGLVMPVAVRLLAWGNGESITSVDTISEHYYTVGRDLFVLTLAAVGLLMYYYRTEYWWDNVVARITGLTAVGIGVFPMRPDWATRLEETSRPCNASHNCALSTFPQTYNWPKLEVAGHTLIQGLHGVSLTCFVLGGLYLVFFSFPRTSVRKTLELESGAPHTPLSIYKLRRNVLISCCAWIMLISILVFSGASLVFKGTDAQTYAWGRFVSESLFVMTFAVAWLVKGQRTPFPTVNRFISDPDQSVMRRVTQVPTLAPPPSPLPCPVLMTAGPDGQVTDPSGHLPPDHHP